MTSEPIPTLADMLFGTSRYDTTVVTSLFGLFVLLCHTFIVVFMLLIDVLSFLLLFYIYTTRLYLFYFVSGGDKTEGVYA